MLYILLVTMSSFEQQHTIINVIKHMHALKILLFITVHYFKVNFAAFTAASASTNPYP